MRADTLVCTLGVCKDIASEFARHLKPNVTSQSLCEADNFEKFVCDGWRAENKLRPEQGRMSYDNIVQDRVDLILQGFLNDTASPIDTPADRESFSMLKAAYTACMNEAEVKRQGMEPVLKLLQDVVKLFPVNDTAYQNLGTMAVKESGVTNLGELLLYFTRSGLGSAGLAGIGIGRDDKKPDETLVFVFPPDELTLSREYYQDNETIADYQAAMAKLLASSHPSALARGKADQLARQVVEYETKLNNLLPDISSMGNVTLYYNIMSLADTTKLLPVLGIDHVLKSLGPSGYAYDRMDTSFPEVLKSLTDVLLNASMETVQTYFLWNVLDRYSRTVRAPEMEPYRIFKNILSGQDPPDSFPDRWRTCKDHVSSMGNLGWILGRFYANKHFSPEAIKISQGLVSAVKQQYEKSIKSLTWLDDSVKKTAMEKLNKTSALMGYAEKLPVNVTDANSVRDYYKGLNITTDFFDNTVAMTEREILRDWSKLGKPYDKAEWQMTPQTVNAYNDQTVNQIAFPAAILQTPYFDADLPSYINFGQTGWTVGHELSHSFDSGGKFYGVDGAYGDSWWTPHADAEFTAREQCFIDQYNAFTVPAADAGGAPIHVNGKQTLGENIADAGGTDNAFLAWKQFVADRGTPDPDLPGLEAWTHDQLFFVSYANGWCSTTRPQGLISQVYADVHAPAQFRVTGPLMNSHYFRETFGCAGKEPTCKIW